jgi:hypothetical protein
MLRVMKCTMNLAAAVNPVFERAGYAAKGRALRTAPSLRPGSSSYTSGEAVEPLSLYCISEFINMSFRHKVKAKVKDAFSKRSGPNTPLVSTVAPAPQPAATGASPVCTTAKDGLRLTHPRAYYRLFV